MARGRSGRHLDPTIPQSASRRHPHVPSMPQIAQRLAVLSQRQRIVPICKVSIPESSQLFRCIKAFALRDEGGLLRGGKWGEAIPLDWVLLVLERLVDFFSVLLMLQGLDRIRIRQVLALLHGSVVIRVKSGSMSVCALSGWNALLTEDQGWLAVEYTFAQPVGNISTAMRHKHEFLQHRGASEM